jgi:uncharacterized repeat protein (TIGR01451 family)
MNRLIATCILSLCAVLANGVAQAATPVELSSDVYVEKRVKRANGQNATILEKPNMVIPGDNLVFVVKYRNVGAAPASRFVVTNPLPSAVAFNGTSDGLEVVSIDGGKSWGFLPSLRVRGENGSVRPALMADVTHIRWNLNQTLASGSEGKLIFRGIVK